MISTPGLEGSSGTSRSFPPTTYTTANWKIRECETFQNHCNKKPDSTTINRTLDVSEMQLSN